MRSLKLATTTNGVLTRMMVEAVEPVQLACGCWRPIGWPCWWRSWWWRQCQRWWWRQWGWKCSPELVGGSLKWTSMWVLFTGLKIFLVVAWLQWTKINKKRGINIAHVGLDFTFVEVANALLQFHNIQTSLNVWHWQEEGAIKNEILVHVTWSKDQMNTVKFGIGRLFSGILFCSIIICAVQKPGFGQDAFS